MRICSLIASIARFAAKSVRKRSSTSRLISIEGFLGAANALRTSLTACLASADSGTPPRALVETSTAINPVTIFLFINIHLRGNMRKNVKDIF
jgi:hypothetical protein